MRKANVDYEKVKKMYLEIYLENKATLKDMGKEFEVNESTIRNIANRLNLPKRKRSKKYKQSEQVDQVDEGKVIALYKAGWKLNDICWDTKAKMPEVTKIIREHIKKEQQKRKLAM